MCGQSSQNTSVDLPNWLDSAGKLISKKGTKLLNKDYKPYKGDLVAGFNSDQQAAFDTINSVFGGSGSDATGYSASNITPAAIGMTMGAANAPAQSVLDAETKGLISGAANAPASTVGGDQWQSLIDAFTSAGAQTVGGGGTLDMVRNAATADAQKVGTERIVDENGRLGKVSDYMDPYLEASISPNIRRMEEDAATQRLALKGAATSAGAFGDARHGVLEQGINRDTQRNIGDYAGAAYENAFRNAMSERTSDISRFLQADTTQGQFNEQALGRMFTGAGMELGAQTTNANLAETALNRKERGATDILGKETTNAQLQEAAYARQFAGADRYLAADTTNAQLAETALNRQLYGAQEAANLQTQGQSDFLQRLSALMGVGSAQQQLSQNELDALYQQYQAKQQWPFDTLAAATSAVNGVPYSRTQTTTQNTGGADFISLLGSLLGGFVK